MVTITKKPYRNVKYKNRIAELYVCNFNGKITYKYVDRIDEKIRSKSFSNITSALRDIKKEYKKILV